MYWRLIIIFIRQDHANKKDFNKLYPENKFTCFKLMVVLFGESVGEISDQGKNCLDFGKSDSY